MRTSRRLSGGTLWLQLLLIGALASVVLLGMLVIRQGAATREVSDRLLRDYGAVAAWSYREHVVAELRAAADELLGGVNHGEGLHEGRGVPPAEWIGHSMRWDPVCGCHKPRRGPVPSRGYAFVLGSDTIGVATNHSPRVGFLGDPVPDAPPRTVLTQLTAAERRETNRILTVATRRTPRTSWGYLATVARRGGEPSRILVSRPMATSWGDTIVYAVEYGTRAMEELFGGVLASGALLPPTLLGERANEEMLSLHVSLEDTLPVFARGTMRPDSPMEKALLDPTFGGLTIAAQIRPELGEALFLAEAPSSQVPVLLLMLLFALALTMVAAVQLRREVRFVNERERFVANVSHELRTPLTQVRLVLDTIRLGRERDEAMRRSSIELADREVLRLQHLADGLLRFTRGPRADGAPRVDQDVSEEARRVAAEFAPLASPQDVRIEVVGPASVMARVEPGAVRQVLLNLLDNAVKYGKPGGVVRVAVAPGAGGGARIEVRDEGPGVAPRERERIFGPFERGAEASRRAAGGSGIGLTIVREIATSHGGSARVETADGGGARFVVEFPGAGS
jgi:signal transduction histidine kinase